VLLPAATVTLAVRTVPVGPVRFPVHADTSVLEPDEATGSIPAVKIDLPLAATGTFKATGKRVVETTAAGSVRWTNCDPTQSYTIPVGTTVRTQTGTPFVTGEAIFLPVAILSGNPTTITCPGRNVAITAAKAGTTGNVPAGAINVVPGSYNSVVIRVSNPSGTSGGTHEEFPQVQQKDVSAALATLDRQLDEQLAVAAKSPPDVPDGATVYPETAVRDEAVPGTDVTALVGQELDQFDLSVTSRGSVLAVDPSPIQDIGKARVAAAVPAGMDLVEGSEQVVVSPGAVDGQSVNFQASARASAFPRIDATEVRDAVRGRTPDQARDALAGYGVVTITLWPDWTKTITGVDARLDVHVVGLPAPRTPGASGAPEASPPAIDRSATPGGGSAEPGATFSDAPGSAAPGESPSPPDAAPSDAPSPGS
jgi:hypothetical protein